MSRVCAIVQPHYLPWIGYFAMIAAVDTFVFLDDVQFIKREWKNRNRIRRTATADDTKFLSVPIRKETQSLPINEALIGGDPDWVDYHLNSLRAVYAKAPHFDAWFAEFETSLMQVAAPGGGREQNLADLNIGLIDAFCERLGIATERVRSSTLGAEGKREHKLLAICRALGATTYLANDRTATYVGADFFEQAGVAFTTQNYRHPVYDQTSDGRALPFVSHLSVVDLLFNAGPESLDILRLNH